MRRLTALVVDDEMLVREGLRSTVNWSALGYELVGEAADGAEALEIAKRLSPDLVLTDIRMPRMDGLELIKQLKSVSPTTKVIVLSAYTDFEYVREAMQLWGALDYIPKLSMKAEDLSRVLSAVREHVERESTAQTDAGPTVARLDALRRYFAYLAESTPSATTYDSGAAGVRVGFQRPVRVAILVCWPLAPGNEVESARDRDRRDLRIVELFDRMATDYRAAIDIFPRDERTLAALFDSETSPEVVRKILRAAAREGAESMGVRLIVGITDEVYDQGSISEALDAAFRAAGFSFFGAGPIISTDSVPPAVEARGILSGELRSQLRESASMAQWDRIRVLITGALTAIQSKGVHDPYLIFGDLNEVDRIARNALAELGVGEAAASRSRDRFTLFATPNVAAASREIEFLAESWRLALETHRRTRYSIAVRQAIDHLESNLTKVTSLYELASRTGMSEAYLSHLFKREVGIGVVEFANRRKVELAKWLLSHHEETIAEIAERVGFQNVGYFGKVFKRIAGVPPAAYRRHPPADDFGET